MSIQAIHHYHNAVHKIYQFSGQTHEQAIKDEFKRLLNNYCDARNLLVVSEINIKNNRGEFAYNNYYCSCCELPFWSCSP